MKPLIFAPLHRSLRYLSTCLLTPGLGRPALAAYPDRPITLIVPFNTGTTPDIVSRLLADAVGKALGQTVPVIKLAELVALARKQPGKLTVGSGGKGTTGHLSAEMLKAMAGLYFLHLPYKGGSGADLALMRGEVGWCSSKSPRSSRTWPAASC